MKSAQDRITLLNQARLYGILDFGYLNGRDPLQVARDLLDGGVDLLQLRAKGQSAHSLIQLCQALSEMCCPTPTLFVINDHTELAQQFPCIDGLHIGQDDGAIDKTRNEIHSGQLIGRSTHSLEQAITAEAEGADYIGVGPIWSTPTKPTYEPVGLSLPAQVRDVVRIPQFCIGGIKKENLRQALAAGARRVVIVSGILQAEDIPAYCREVRLKLETQSNWP